MIDKTHMNRIRVQILDYSKKRREMIKSASDVQHWSKKAIFALQRDDKTLANDLLKKSEKLLGELNKKYKGNPRVLSEGSYKACLEEYVEAVLFKQFLNGKKLGKVAKFHVDENVYIGGLCDVPGELLRYAIKSATERNYDMVSKCFAVAQEIIAVTMDMNLTGYNRQKYDQAKGALNKLQYTAYEVSMKKE